MERKFSEVILAYLQDWMDALTYLFKTCHSPEQAQDLAEQASARFQGALIQHRLGQVEPLLRQKGYLLETFDRGLLSKIDYSLFEETQAA